MDSKTFDPSEALRSAVQALGDWATVEAPEINPEDKVLKARHRIDEAGGVGCRALSEAKKIKHYLALELSSLTDKDKSDLCSVLNAFFDWYATSSKALFDEQTISEARQRIMLGGGTLAYISKHRMSLERLLARLSVEEAG